jgi:hypothetical protein
MSETATGREAQKTIRVVNVWYNDSGDAKIVLLAPVDPSRKLNVDLFWYSGNHRPKWNRGDELTDGDVLSTKCYKQRKFTSIDQDIPNDCYMAF